MNLEKKIPGLLVNYLRGTESNMVYEGYLIPRSISNSSLQGIIGVEKTEQKEIVPFFNKLIGNKKTKTIKKVIFLVSAGSEEFMDPHPHYVEFPKSNLFKEAYKQLIETAERQNIKLTSSGLDNLFAPIRKELMSWYSD